MGAYLSEPITEKCSTDESGPRVSYGASSMQGWRMTQEDAHNTILNYDKDTSFFAVYDGHGGSEVAKYCALKLPDFVKSLKSYAEGELTEALCEGFLQFDATLITPGGLSELKMLAGASSDDSAEASPDEGEAELLSAEAEMPIEDLLARYSAKAKELAKEVAKLDGAKPNAGEEDPAKPNEDKLVNGDCSAASRDVEASAAEKGDRLLLHEGRSTASEADGGEGSSSGGDTPEGTRRLRRPWKPYMSLVANADASLDSSESEESSEEEEEDGEDEEDEEDEEEEEEEAEEEGDAESVQQMLGNFCLLTCTPLPAQQVGYDSGCTAVVALVRGRTLVVANAGDSRCVVCRSGKAVDMSLDHKPEDATELSRICRAGGRVTRDGRVNGGLNLSRAIGDHAYKRNTELELRDQMITALPDIKTLELDPETDEFMILACDGIWYVLNASLQTRRNRQKLSVLVGHRIPHACSSLLSQLFDACLAPDTSGDGTGCDNMTCIVAQFHREDFGDPSGASNTKERKRCLSSEDESRQDESNKKAKADDA
ncbi:protein phosphatase, putative [Ixodes scapularis]|uniref:protein-serine/threonine phosphatase n=1 Tax=Ixodes scapularis TaxID=6945 RepID=B7QHE9_IXOSC|nr:protein phosphatase, putative [Ixodes scapularis]|eukprot:XP_002414606.1 protein phosphatase, putative [Ixodes scapularis]